MFDILNVENLEFDTTSYVGDLDLEQNGTYHVWIMGKFTMVL